MAAKSYARLKIKFSGNKYNFLFIPVSFFLQLHLGCVNQVNLMLNCNIRNSRNSLLRTQEASVTDLKDLFVLIHDGALQSHGNMVGCPHANQNYRAYQNHFIE